MKMNEFFISIKVVRKESQGLVITTKGTSRRGRFVVSTRFGCVIEGVSNLNEAMTSATMMTRKQTRLRFALN